MNLIFYLRSSNLTEVKIVNCLINWNDRWCSMIKSSMACLQVWHDIIFWYFSAFLPPFLCSAVLIMYNMCPSVCVRLLAGADIVSRRPGTISWCPPLSLSLSSHPAPLIRRQFRQRQLQHPTWTSSSLSLRSQPILDIRNGQTRSVHVMSSLVLGP